MMFETSRSDGSFTPLKRRSLRVVSHNEFINGQAYLEGRRKTGPLQRLSPENAKPPLCLVKPGSTGRHKMEVNVGMALQPAIFFGLMSILPDDWLSDIAPSDIAQPDGVINPSYVTCSARYSLETTP
jgi:hypothetical protein